MLEWVFGWWAWGGAFGCSGLSSLQQRFRVAANLKALCIQAEKPSASNHTIKNAPPKTHH
jgi:hypothetical protein